MPELNIAEHATAVMDFAQGHVKELLTLTALGAASVGLMGASAPGSGEAAPAISTTTAEAPTTSIETPNDLNYVQPTCDVDKPGFVSGMFELSNVPVNTPAEVTVNDEAATVVVEGEGGRLESFEARYKKTAPSFDIVVKIDGNTLERTSDITSSSVCKAVADVPDTTTTTTEAPTTTTTTTEVPVTTTTTEVPPVTESTTTTIVKSPASTLAPGSTLAAPEGTNPVTSITIAPKVQQQDPGTAIEGPAVPVVGDANYTG